METFAIFAEILESLERRHLRVVLMDEASAFIRSLPEKAQKKITYNLLQVESGRMDAELFKKLAETDILEFRTLFNGVTYRLFAFWDTEHHTKRNGADERHETLVVATHGIVKKTRKTPAKEIRKAENLRTQYFDNKKRI